MSRSAKVTLDWADGTYPFRLAIEQLAELQEKTEAGPWFIQWALSRMLLSAQSNLEPPREASPAYVTETIRLGLIGGGMDPIRALKKVRDYVGPGQLTANITYAFAILGAALQGVEEDEPEKPAAESEMSDQSFRADESGSLKSTGSAPPSDYARAKSGSVPSGSSMRQLPDGTQPTRRSKKRA